MIEQIRDYLTTQDINYVVAGTAVISGGVGLILGGLVGRLRSGRRDAEAQRRHAEKLAQLNLDAAKEQRLTAEQGNVVELKKIGSEEAQRAYERETESRKYHEGVELQQREHNAQQLREVRDKIVPYLKELTEQARIANTRVVSPEQAKAREEYSIKLLDEYEEALREDEGVKSEDFDISDDDVNRINRWVDARFPPQSNSQVQRLPPEISRLIELLEDDSE